MKFIKLLLKNLVLSVGIDFKFLSPKMRFQVKNRNFWKVYPGSSKSGSMDVIVSENLNNIYLALGLAVLASIIANEKKAGVLYLSYSGESNNSLDWIRKTFSHCYFETVDDLTRDLEPEIAGTAKKLLSNLNEPGELLNLRYKGILIGDLVYDSSLVEGNWQASVWKIDERVLSVLIKYIKLFYALEKISVKYHVKAASFSHNIGMAALVLRYFSSQGLTNYAGIVGSGPIKKYANFNGNKLPYVGSMRKDFLAKLISNTDQKKSYLSKADRYLEERFSGRSNDLDSPKAFSREKKIYTTKSDFCTDYNLDPGKPCIFIMLHAFNDFPHHFNENIFTDYYRWFIETLKIANNNPDVNWIFKQHPSSIFYPDDANLKGIFEVNPIKNIVFFDNNSSFNTISLKNIADAIITCIGTAALEFSCFGIPAIIAGENHFSDFDIVLRAKNFDEYQDLLNNIHNSPLPKLSIDNMEKARILFYLQYKHVTGVTSNNNAFLPQDSHEEKLKNDMNATLTYYINQLEKPGTKDFIETVRSFINDKNSELFFSDKKLAEIESSIANDRN